MNPHHRSNYILAVWLLLLLAGCHKEGSSRQLKTEALLVWTGEHLTDGCGFYIEVDDLEYKPENESIIPDNFKQEQYSRVIITYSQGRERITYNCGVAHELQGNGIRLTSIRKVE